MNTWAGETLCKSRVLASDPENSPYDFRASSKRWGTTFTATPYTAEKEVPIPMNKADLVNMVQHRTKLTKTDVSQVVDAAIEEIIDAVVDGKKVSILGFGSFEPRERSARQGLNPKTGEKIKIPAKRVPAFTAGKMFKDRVQMADTDQELTHDDAPSEAPQESL